MRVLTLVVLVICCIGSAQILTDTVRASSSGSSSATTSKATTRPTTTSKSTTRPTTTSKATTKPVTTSKTTTNPTTTSKATTRPTTTSETTTKLVTTSKTTTKPVTTSKTTTRPVTTKPATTSTATSRPTMTSSSYINCYSCGDISGPCPQPFIASSPNVLILSSSNRFCEKISPVKGDAKLITRGPAKLDNCNQRGCYIKNINNQRMEVCCCDRNMCNMGIKSMKSTWILVLSTLAVILLRKF
ncbi:unnamed protein product [Rotaria sordida]|uniref:Uncharacterized protein n=1 Tax=Rotaria sordida TaxID=392033 RepID=A0A814L2R0_9BILA|nr:unnamed protein product [Rotaria sordida]